MFFNLYLAKALLKSVRVKCLPELVYNVANVEAVLVLVVMRGGVIHAGGDVAMRRGGSCWW